MKPFKIIFGTILKRGKTHLEGIVFNNGSIAVKQPHNRGIETFSSIKHLYICYNLDLKTCFFRIYRGLPLMPEIDSSQKDEIFKELK